MQEFSQEEAAGVVVGRESCDRTGVRNYGIDEDIGNVRCIKPVAQFLGFLDEGRADDNGVGFLVGDAVECGFAGIYVVLVVVGVVAGDIDVRILFDGVLDTRLDGTPVLSGTGDGGGDSDPESLSAGDGRDVEVELVVYFASTRSTDSRLVRETLPRLCRIRSTVPAETPAIFAISLIFIFCRTICICLSGFIRCKFITNYFAFQKKWLHLQGVYEHSWLKSCEEAGDWRVYDFEYL